MAANELTRIQQELCAATWIRNTHSKFQLREFMADFWNNHFNIGRQADIFGSATLPIYDSEVIRPRVFGNFRDLLGAVAKSAAMLRYLNNAESTAALPTKIMPVRFWNCIRWGAGRISGRCRHSRGRSYSAT